MADGAEYRDLGESAWRWVLDQVQWDDGPWVPATPGGAMPEFRDEMHSGLAGLAYVLAEVRLARAWTPDEQRLADGTVERLRRAVATQTDASFFVGLASAIGGLVALGEDPAPAADRLMALATPDGWPQSLVGPPRYADGAPLTDLTLGAAGVLLAGVWAGRHDVADHAGDVLLSAAEETPAGLAWGMAAPRYRLESRVAMPNFSHGTAGVAAALAVGGQVLGRPDLLAAAESGAEHLVTLADPDTDGFAVPHIVPMVPDFDEDVVTWTWCHGPTGTSLLFVALEEARVSEVAGRPVADWHRDCLHAVRRSGIPERLRPGFWDNDGRCCGTAGVADVFLDTWQRRGEDDDLAFTLVLADALVDRAHVVGDRACWRFVEHRDPEPLLPPGVGWMQGVAGIAAFLLRLGRTLDTGRDAPVVGRMENWWGLPPGVSSRPRPRG